MDSKVFYPTLTMIQKCSFVFHSNLVLRQLTNLVDIHSPPVLLSFPMLVQQCDPDPECAACLALRPPTHTSNANTYTSGFEKRVFLITNCLLWHIWCLERNLCNPFRKSSKGTYQPYSFSILPIPSKISSIDAANENLT